MTLKELLDSEGFLDWSSLVSTKLIDRVEICGFVNSVTDVYREIMNGVALNQVVNKVHSNLIVVSGYVYQAIDGIYKNEPHTYVIASPIYSSLSKCDEIQEYNLEDLIIPSLCSNKVYLEIKKRVGTGMEVTDYTISKAKFPERFHIEAKNGKAMMTVNPGDILCKKNGVVKSVGEDVLVLIRYIVPETGITGYAHYSLDEVFVDIPC